MNSYSKFRFFKLLNITHPSGVVTMVVVIQDLNKNNSYRNLCVRLLLMLQNVHVCFVSGVC